MNFERWCSKVAEHTPNERDQAILELWANNIVPREIGERFGISREWVRQIVKKYVTPESEWTLRRNEIRARLVLQKKRQVAKAKLEELESRPRCLICQIRPVYRKNAKTCSGPRCRQSYYLIRSDLPENWASYCTSQAKYILSHPDRFTKARIEWAKRTLSEGPIPPNRKFIVLGSKRGKLRIKLGLYQPDQAASS